MGLDGGMLQFMEFMKTLLFARMFFGLLLFVQCLLRLVFPFGFWIFVSHDFSGWFPLPW